MKNGIFLHCSVHVEFAELVTTANPLYKQEHSEGETAAVFIDYNCLKFIHCL